MEGDNYTWSTLTTATDKGDCFENEFQFNMFHILAPSQDTGIRVLIHFFPAMLNCRLPHWCLQRTRVFFVDTAWGFETTISSVFAACKVLQWDLQRLLLILLLYPWEENLMQKDLMILHKLFAPFAFKVGTAAPFSAQWWTQNIAMLIRGHHDNGILKPQSSSFNVNDSFCITRDNVPAVQY